MPTLEEQSSGVEVRLQAVSAVSDRIAWASGLGGVWVRTVDGGATWSHGVIEAEPELQFRDVQGLGAEVAYLLSSGPGAASRVYKTLDGGRTWALQKMAEHPQSFWDCFDFWDADRGLMFGDSVDSALEVYRTDDGGDSWRRLESLPPALDGEGGFAASGTCLEVWGDSAAHFVTGAAKLARRFVTEDGGETWKVEKLPLPSGEAKGATSVLRVAPTERWESPLAGPGPHTGEPDRTLAMGGELTFVFGGELADRETRHEAVAVTWDRGVSWRLRPRPGFQGPIYGSALTWTGPSPTLVAIGPMGAEVSFDLGSTWREIGTANYWSVDIAPAVDGESAGRSTGWMVGPEGRITRLIFGP